MRHNRYKKTISNGPLQMLMAAMMLIGNLDKANNIDKDKT